MSGFSRRRRIRETKQLEYDKLLEEEEKEKEQERLNRQRVSNLDCESSGTGIKQKTLAVASESFTTKFSTESSSIPTLAIDSNQSRKDPYLNLNRNHSHKQRRFFSEINNNDDNYDDGNKKDDPNSKKRKKISSSDEDVSISNTRISPSFFSIPRRLDDVPDRVMDCNLVGTISSQSQSSLPKNHDPGSAAPTNLTSIEPSPMKDGNQSDSDDDDTFFQLVPRSKEIKKYPSSNTETSQPRHVSSPPNNGMRTIKKGSSIGFSDNEDPLDEVQTTFNSQKKDNASSSRDKIESHHNETKHDDDEMTRNRNHDNDNDDDSGEDDDGYIGMNDKGKSASGREKKKSKSRAKKSIRRNSSDSSDDEQSDSEDNYMKKSPRRARNPITVAKEQETSFYSGMKTDNHQNTLSSKDDDDFWDECEVIESPEKKKKSQSKEKRTSDSSRRKSGNKKPHKDMKRSGSDDDYLSTDGEDMLPQDTDIGLEDLKPFFDIPQFGPYEPMEPLLLTTDQTNGQILQVPASLNRYLIPFQKDGARFLYECLSRKSGAILGDEMGCGKTVQIIALLCALFNKTGTGKDLLNINQRNSLVRKQRSKVQKLKDQALCNGEVVEENIEEWKTTLSLSPWHPVMIIVPPTICETWKRTFKEFSHFSVSLYRGKERAEALKSVLYGSTDILLVPKSSFQNNHHYSELEIVKWKLVIIDEFHNFKNHDAKLSIHLRELKEQHHPLVIGMTGTPMQNNYTELWNLVDLAQTNYLGTREAFKKEIDRPMTYGRQKGANPTARSNSKAISERLRKMLNKIMIKRNKEDVFPDDQIPEKNEQAILCDLSPLQKEVYMHVLELPDFELVRHGSRPCDCGINKNVFRKIQQLSCKAEQLEYYRTHKDDIIKQSRCCKKLPVNPRFGEEGEPYVDQDGTIWRAMEAHTTDNTTANEGCERCPYCCTFPCLMKLKQLSSHLGLLQVRKTKEAQVKGSPAYIKYMKEREFAKVSLAGVVSRLPGEGYEFHQGIMDDHFSLSGKLRVLARLLEKYYNECGKVLLFAHSTQTLDLIEHWLKSRGSFVHLRMDGSTATNKRQAIADEFNTNQHIFLFLLSTKAMGQGLNLTSANKVIIFDVDWNPSWEIQAQDRAHRIGQTRNVDVIRLVSKGTIEEMIYLRQIYKMHLKQDALVDNDDSHAEAPRVFRGVQGDKHMKGEIFGTVNLFRFKENGSFLDDIWAESKTTGKDNDPSGLKIHDSTKMAQMLLNVGDDHGKELEENEDMAVIQKALLEKVRGPEMVKEIKTKRDAFDIEESDSDEENNNNKEPLENQVRALTHNDLLRSDKGRPTIIDGEDGFDEEMGGQTQEAYAMYENAKDLLYDDEEEDDDDNNDDDTKNRELPVKSEFSKEKAKNSTVATSVIKSNVAKIKNEPETTSTNNIDQTAKLKKPQMTPISSVMGEGHTVKINASETMAKSKAPQMEKDPTEKINATKTMPGSSIDKVKAAKANVSKRSTKNGNKNKNKKIKLMGVKDVRNEKTEFSNIDFAIPDYGKKKKKKKKKKKQKGSI
mmetsp:Transcript_203/g.263  ORF Transcript_203/g.263 Transcript_203/m.263 type:complete len:1537 (-) Transcript_203:110-4720(-)